MPELPVRASQTQSCDGIGHMWLSPENDTACDTPLPENVRTIWDPKVREEIGKIAQGLAAGAGLGATSFAEWLDASRILSEDDRKPRFRRSTWTAPGDARNLPPRAESASG